MHIFLDVEDLTSGYGAESVDSSQYILVFAMPVYFQKINCIRELVRAIVRDKPLILLLPDAEVHGEFTQAMISDIVTDEWVQQWALETLVSEWAADWDVADLKPPVASELCDALFKQPPLEWSRLTAFQDRTMVLMCQRLLPEVRHGIYLQGMADFTPPKGHTSVKTYCSPHNPGAIALANELNDQFGHRINRAPYHGTASSCSPLVEIVSSLDNCDHMLIYLNALTWKHDPEAFAADIREAQSLGVHLQLCHEFPSVLDPRSARDALGFAQIMGATPPHLKSGPRNIYQTIAVSLKGGELRRVGLAALAARLVIRVPRAPVADDPPAPAAAFPSLGQPTSESRV